MHSKRSDDFTLFFDSSEQETAQLIFDTAGKALRYIQESWGLSRPEDCRIYVMTSWLGFFFRSAPWPWRIILAISLPFWGFRARRTWPYSAAWTQQYSRRVAIGIKPSRLLEISDKSIGMQMFVEEKETKAKVQHLICHELTHACSVPLKLPAWLNEGLAGVTVDRFLGKRTIRADTLEIVRNYLPKGGPPSYRELSRLGSQAIAYHAVRGYWLVRYLEEKCPGLLKRIFSMPPLIPVVADEIARGLGLDPNDFWNQIDAVMVDYFQ